MTHVTQSENGHSEKWYWPAQGFGELAVRLLQHRLDKKAAGRIACCRNEELMSDIWFDGFPELIQRKQTVGAMYRKHTPSEQSNTQSLREHNAKQIVKLSTRRQKRRPRLGNAPAKTSNKAAA